MTVSAPKVTVLMPTYNQCRYIDKAVRSILTQSFTDFEMIIFNDGSTDGTADYLATITDPRVRIIHQENIGFTCSVNNGIRLARGEFITWIGSDNIHEPWFLAALLGGLAAFPETGFAYSAFYLMDENDTITSLVSCNHLAPRNLAISENGFGAPTFLYRRSYHDVVGYYDEDMKYACDTDFWERILRHAKPVYVIEPTARFREHGEAASTTKKDVIGQDMGKAIMRNLNEIVTGERDLASIYGSHPDFPTDMFAIACDFGAKVALRTRNPRMAAPFYEQALSLTPRRQLLETLTAYVGLSTHLASNELLAKVSAALRKNQALTADDFELAASLVLEMRALAVSVAVDPAQVKVLLVCPVLERYMWRDRRTYSYISTLAAQNGLLPS
ncbi:hypothetical protein CU669_08960 [Paramagnetospirillum kuznetsovii]|uniref:Glycosyltransferase 2-like domain-containing protein n=1 Tax=Paramagnetospirillum kuznetsovii TaxID=2053833 RepID=A0A364NYV3_9PROT|nr:glycosyltransferase [Paramagnetospirillum kuznetsovii]RAU22246.1 hypothetical protein CU669_08960 [Paramagnetospirillum kuznetsovii]